MIGTSEQRAVNNRARDEDRQGNLVTKGTKGWGEPQSFEPLVVLLFGNNRGGRSTSEAASDGDVLGVRGSAQFSTILAPAVI